MEVITFESRVYKDLSARMARIEEAIENRKQFQTDELQLLSSDEVCNFLRISRRTLARLTASGEIAYTKSGRKLLFIKSDVERFLEERREGGIR